MLSLPPFAVMAPDVYTPFASTLAEPDAPAMFTSPEDATAPANRMPPLVLVAEPMDIAPPPEILPPYSAPPAMLGVMLLSVNKLVRPAPVLSTIRVPEVSADKAP